MENYKYDTGLERGLHITVQTTSCTNNMSLNDVNGLSVRALCPTTMVINVDEDIE